MSPIAVIRRALIWRDGQVVQYRRPPQFGHLPAEPLMALVEVLSVCCCFWWALSLVVYSHQFEQNHSFTALLRIAPQWAWAIVAISIGISHALTLLIPVPEYIQRWSTLLSIGWWGVIAGSIAIVSPFGTGVGVYVALALMQAGRLRRV